MKVTLAGLTVAERIRIVERVGAFPTAVRRLAAVGGNHPHIAEE